MRAVVLYELLEVVEHGVDRRITPPPAGSAARAAAARRSGRRPEPIPSPALPVALDLGRRGRDRGARRGAGVRGGDGEWAFGVPSLSGIYDCLDWRFGVLSEGGSKERKWGRH